MSTARYAFTVTDERTKAPIAGMDIYVYDQATGQAAVMTDDLGQPLTNPLVTDTFGFAYFNAVQNLYRADFYLDGRLRFKETNIVVGDSNVVLKGAPPVAGRAGKFLAYDADGNPIASSGTGGGDASLRSDLAAATGAQMIGAGVFTSPLIADNTTVKGAIESIGTNLAANGGAAQVGTSTGASVETRLAALVAADVAQDLVIDAALLEIDNAKVRITATEAQTARIQKMSPPFTQVAGIYVGDVIPTAANPVATKRLHADWIIVRVRSATLAAVSVDDIYWDEFYFRNSRGYADVESGWQLVNWGAYYNARYSDFLCAPDDPGGIPNADFAIRLGKYDPANLNPAYHSGGEGPAYFYTGFGHGRCAASDADISIILSGSGSNLNPVSAWPVGTTLYGSSLDITTQFKLRTLTATLGSNPIATTNGSGTITVSHTAHGYSTGQFVKLEGVPFVGINGLTYAQLVGRRQITVVNANSYTMATGGTATSTGSGGGSAVQAFADVVSLTYEQSLGTWGLRRKGGYAASLAGYGIQDSYGYMLPINPYFMTDFKAEGAAAIKLTQDGQQKGTSTTGTANYHQVYNSARPTIVGTLQLEYGQPLRKALGGLAAWGQNKAGRYFFRDLGDYAKYYVFINSSEESPPRTAWPMTVGEVFEWQSLLYTEYRPGGPR